MVGLVVAVLFTGCASNSSNNGNSSNTETKSTTPASSTTTPTKTPEKDITLKIMGLTPSHTENVKAIVTDYEAEHPGVKVDFFIPPDNGAALLKTRFASGDAPDIFYLSAAEIPAWAEKLEDLSDEPWMPHVLPAGLRNIVLDGKKVGFPMQIEGNGFVYNKDLFEQAGITSVPTTLTELQQTAEKLEAAGIQPFGEAWKNWGFLAHIFGITFVHETDQKGFIDELNKGTKEIKDLTNIDNFFTLLDLTNDYGLGKESVAYDFTQQQQDFANGKIAMIKQGTWYTTSLTKLNPDLNMGLFAAPMSDNPADTKLLIAATGNFVVNNESENIEESKAFLTWLHKNGSKYIVEKMKLAPVFDDISASELGKLYADMEEYNKTGNTYDNFGTELWPAGFNTEIAKPLQAYIGGVIDKEEALKQLQELWSQRVNQ